MKPNDVVISVIGARPHFVKAFPLIREMSGRRTRHFLLHTGQHYDERMSRIFFDQLVMPAPDVNLGVGSGTHAEQTAKIMIGVEKIAREVNPKAVIVYGDTNTTLAAAIAVAKQYIPLVHIEAGVRAGNRRMPEELNRILVDHISDFLICPCELAVRNLHGEGRHHGVLNLGDLMYDSFLAARSAALSRSTALRDFGVKPGEYLLATIHREASTENVETLIAILHTLASLGETVILPMHPRTRARLAATAYTLGGSGGLRIVEPLGYLDMLRMLLHARKVITDSGGVQKEAYWAGVPCVTLMNETGWPETVEAGWNVLVGMDCRRIREAAQSVIPTGDRPEVYGPPGAARRLVEAMGWS